MKRTIQLTPVISAHVQTSIPGHVDPSDPLAPLKRIAQKHAPPHHYVRVTSSDLPFTNEQLP